MSDDQSTYTVLVTGANSGLGYATCCRLIDEFLFTRPQSQTLHLLITTRSSRKSEDTLARLRTHLQKTMRAANGKTLGISILLERRVQLEAAQLDLCDLSSVKALATELLNRKQHVDVLVLNAGIGGWCGIDWPRAIWTILTDWKNATTWPTFKLGYVGNTAPRQLKQKQEEANKQQQQQQEQEAEPQLGEVFTANVFGHYMLAHALAPLMTSHSSTTDPGRIIWISSLEAYAHRFSITDLQGLHTDASYESSKRLTDLLVLTADLPATKPWRDAFLCLDQPAPYERQPPRLLLAHPGICGTAIANLHPILSALMYAAFYISRWLGSPWHPTTAYLGAVSSVWLALTPLAELTRIERAEGKGKWGSSTDVLGHERVIRTEVAGWGWGGGACEVVDGGVRLVGGRWKGAGGKETTDEDRVEFEALGREVWREMERLRREWESRLGWHVKTPGTGHVA